MQNLAACVLLPQAHLLNFNMCNGKARNETGIIYDIQLQGNLVIHFNINKSSAIEMKESLIKPDEFAIV